MTAPALPQNPSLDTLRNQITYTKFAIALDAHAKPFAAAFDALLKRHGTVVVGQHACWDAQTLAGLKIQRADRVLDAHVDGFVADLVHEYGDNASDGVQHYLRGRTKTAIKKSVLGPEVVIVAEWITSIAAEKSETLRAWGPVFEADLAAAEKATEESVTADANNRVFREKGPLSELIAALTSARDVAHNGLEAFRLAHKGEALAADWPNTFFMPPTPGALNDAERAAKAAAKAAARHEAEQARVERAAAIQKLREAQAALKALKKK